MNRRATVSPILDYDRIYNPHPYFEVQYSYGQCILYCSECFVIIRTVFYNTHVFEFVYTFLLKQALTGFCSFCQNANQSQHTVQ